MAPRPTIRVTINDTTNPHNLTSPLPAEADWSWTLLPAVIGQLEPLAAFHALRGLYVPILMENGVAARDAAGKPIRDFPFLPQYLSNNLESFRMEAYFRSDPRLQYQDLWARMPTPTPQFCKVDVTRISQRRHRQVRLPNNCMSWMKGPGSPRVMVEVVENLSSLQLAHNTTWTVTAAGILRPGTTTPVLPLTTFLEPGTTTYTPSAEMTQAVSDLLHLQQLAREHGVNDWKQLPAAMTPAEWKVCAPKITIPLAVRMPAAAAAAAAVAAPVLGWYRRGRGLPAPQPMVQQQAGGNEMEEDQEEDQEAQRDTEQAVEARCALVGGDEIEVEEEEDQKAQRNTVEAVEAGRALMDWIVAGDVDWDDMGQAWL
ncbi:hypothetical protein MMC30_006567 [Trapelia coarctata]|nr:hypothetical protein [Trapelia coarctata]